MVYLLTALLLARPSTAHVQTSAETTATADVILEIRSYNLKPGERERFHDLFVRESLPLLVRAKVDVIGYGPSLHDDDS